MTITGNMWKKPQRKKIMVEFYLFCIFPVTMTLIIHGIHLVYNWAMDKREEREWLEQLHRDMREENSVMDMRNGVIRSLPDGWGDEQ